MSKCRDVFLTFDVEGPPFMEDYMDRRVLWALLKILRLLENYELKGLFFITGSVAEKICSCSEILELLEGHLIGYHSSSHSLRPMIFEYTDVENYDEAVDASLKRETSRVDPSNGRILGEGGILSLQEIFPDKKIESFRAPFLCWTPPHFEALTQLGLKFDFSTGICKIPVLHKGITFYPRPIQVDSRTNSLGYIEFFPYKHFFPNFLLLEILRRGCTVSLMHPAVLVYQKQGFNSEDKGLALNRSLSKPRSEIDVASRLFSAESLFLELALLQKTGAIEVTPTLKEEIRPLDLKKVDLKTIYTMSMRVPQQLFGYKPKFLFFHFQRFFA